MTARAVHRRARVLAVLEGQVGGLHVVVSPYAVALALAVAAGLFVALRRTAFPDTVLVVAPCVVAAGALGAGAWHRVLHGGPGFSSFGAIGAGVVATVVGARLAHIRPLELLDALAPGVVLGFGIGRVGCFLAGCCYGQPTALPWGVVVPEVDLLPRHPVQLYAAAADGLLGAWLARTRGPVGTATRRAAIGYGLLRLVLETWRDPSGTDLLGPYGIAVARLGGAVLVALGLALAARDPAER